VACDASTKAIGAVLSQTRNGEERPVAYCSRQLNLAETKYSVTELEILALIYAVKQFRCYLYGRTFKAGIALLFIYYICSMLKLQLRVHLPSDSVTLLTMSGEAHNTLFPSVK
jgi:hypothetical protein